MIRNKRLTSVVHLSNITQSLAAYSINRSSFSQEIYVIKKVTNKCIKKLGIFNQSKDCSRPIKSTETSLSRARC